MVTLTSVLHKISLDSFCEPCMVVTCHGLVLVGARQLHEAFWLAVPFGADDVM